ncbi:MAG: response regulator [Acidobacteria bacterium]|nr:response regulator [Acidobacteriota bacterium]
MPQISNSDPPRDKPTILLIDDNPAHLSLYWRGVDSGGFRPITVLVAGKDITLPSAETIDLSVLDYQLGPEVTAVAVAKLLQRTFPHKPIVILSDLCWMPDDIRGYAVRFVRKGAAQAKFTTLLFDPEIVTGW